MQSNIINNYGRLQSLSPTMIKRNTTPQLIIEILIIKTSHYKLNKRWCRWYCGDKNKRHYFNGKLLNIVRPNYAAPGEYILEVKCKPDNFSRFTKRLLKHGEFEQVLPRVYWGDL